MTELSYEDLDKARVGQPFEIPAGIKVRSTYPRKSAIRTKRKQTIYPRFVDRYENGLIVVVWSGEGGYWKSVVAERSPETE